MTTRCWLTAMRSRTTSRWCSLDSCCSRTTGRSNIRRVVSCSILFFASCEDIAEFHTHHTRRLLHDSTTYWSHVFTITVKWSDKNNASELMWSAINESSWIVIFCRQRQYLATFHCEPLQSGPKALYSTAFAVRYSKAFVGANTSSAHDRFSLYLKGKRYCIAV